MALTRQMPLTNEMAENSSSLSAHSKIGTSTYVIFNAFELGSLTEFYVFELEEIKRQLTHSI